MHKRPPRADPSPARADRLPLPARLRIRAGSEPAHGICTYPEPETCFRTPLRCPRPLRSRVKAPARETARRQEESRTRPDHAIPPAGRRHTPRWQHHPSRTAERPMATRRMQALRVQVAMAGRRFAGQSTDAPTGDNLRVPLRPAHSHFRRRKKITSPPLTKSIIPSAQPYPNRHCSSGIRSKFIP